MKKSAKICHISIGHNPDDDRIYYKELRSLAKIYRDVHFIAPDRKSPPSDGIIKFHLFPFSKNVLRNAISALRIATSVKADIYHIHEFEFLPFALVLKLKYRRKVIYDAHESVFYYFPDFSRKPRLFTLPVGVISQLLEWFCIMFVDFVITVTPWIKKDLQRFNKKISIIYNYPIKEFFRTMHSSKRKNKTVLYHGQLSHARNIESIIKAFPHVIKRIPDAELKIVGYGPEHYVKKLKELIKCNNLEGYVKIFPPIDYKEIPSLISEATIGLSSMFPNKSFMRSIQVKIFEFMASGIPVLGCNTPANRYYIEKHSTGFVIDPPTPENIARHIIKLLLNPGLVVTLGKNGVEAVEKKFNWNLMEKRLFKIYKLVEEKC